MKKNKSLRVAIASILSLSVVVIGSLSLSSCNSSEAASGGFSAQEMADSLNLVLRSDRKVYARDIVTRLKNEGVLGAHEEWKSEKKLLLPAQAFRRGAEEVDSIEDKPVEFSTEHGECQETYAKGHGRPSVLRRYGWG